VNWLCRAVTVGALERGGLARNWQSLDLLQRVAGHSTVLARLGALGWIASSTGGHRWVCKKPSENRPTTQFCFY